MPKPRSTRLGRAVASVVERLEDRRLLSVVPGSSVLVFNSSIGGPSHTDTLTITNTGSTPVSFPVGAFSVVKDPADAADESAQFSITNAGSLPSTLPAGQSAQVQLVFRASTANTIQRAILQINSDDPATPVVDIPLRGLGTNGTFGYNEPSLVNILRAFNIPTIVGAGPNDADASNSQYPVNPDPSSQEVTMPRLVKAGSGPVTITPLASFDASAAPTLRFGYYTPGQANDRTELFTVGQGDAQTVNPSALGATSFDPGSAGFGLFATFPGISTSNGQPDIHYSEDALNTLDPAHPRKFRFFPLENPDGSIVPNAYVFAAEDFNSTQYNSFTNLVAIIRNVKPAPGAVGAPVLGLENLDVVPSNTRLVLARIQNRYAADPAGFVDSVHDTGTLRIHNTGDAPLVLNSVTLSDSANWMIVNPPAPGTVVPANGGTLDLTVKFIATSAPAHADNQTNDSATTNGVSVQAAGGVWNASLVINSNDPANPTQTVQLAGYWQHTSESENEPGLQTIINKMFGYGTNIANNALTNYPNGAAPITYGEEVLSGLWNVADPTQPISVRQIVAYHSQWDLTQTPPVQTGTRIGWYVPGSSTKILYQQKPGESQSLFPMIAGTSNPAFATFSPSSSFGWNIDGEKSQDSLNTADINNFHRTGHAVRFYPARDADGNLIPNTWLIVQDYQNTQFDNNDYQDNVYLVTNMRPATQAPAPTDVQATTSGGAVVVQWAPVNDSTLLGYNIYRASSASGPYIKINGSPISGTVFFDSASGPAFYLISAVDSAGESQRSAPAGQLATTQPPPPVTDSLTSADINSTPAGSTSVITPGKDYNVTAGGADIGGSAADGFRYVYEQVTGDFDTIVQVTSLTNVQSGTRAGLMVRQDLTPGSPMIFSGATTTDGYRFNYRTTADAIGTFLKFGAVSYPNVWVRLVRQGNVFTGYYSTDGQNWTQTQSLTLTLPSTVYVGMAVSSHSTTQPATATLRNFNLTVTQPGGGGGGGGDGGGGGTQGGGGGGGGTQQPPPGTLAEQVAQDRITLQAAQSDRKQQLRAAQQKLRLDLKTYATAKRALLAAQRAARKAHLPTTSVDPSLSAAVDQALATVQQDRTELKTLQKTDFTGIKAARKQLATDMIALRKSRRHRHR